MYLHAIVQVIENRINSYSQREEFGQTSHGLDPHGTIGVSQSLQVGGLQLWQKGLGSCSNLQQ